MNRRQKRSERPFQRQSSGQGQRHSLTVLPSPPSSGKPETVSPLSRLADQRKRPCGECKACCTALAVESIGKEAGEECRFLADVSGCSCSIYSDRPEQCATYYCFYAFGMLVGGEENRPDNLGVLFSATPEISGVMITVNELRAGAADSPKVQAIMDVVGERMVVLLGRAGSDFRTMVRKPAGTGEVMMVKGVGSWRERGRR